MRETHIHGPCFVLKGCARFAWLSSVAFAPRFRRAATARRAFVGTQTFVKACDCLVAQWRRTADAGGKIALSADGVMGLAAGVATADPTESD